MKCVFSSKITLVYQRSLTIPNIDTLDRCALLKLFHTFALPRAQRNAHQSKNANRPDPATESASQQRNTTCCTNDVDMEQATVSSLTLDCQKIQISNDRKRPMIVIRIRFT